MAKEFHKKVTIDWQVDMPDTLSDFHFSWIAIHELPLLVVGQVFDKPHFGKLTDIGGISRA